MPDHVSILTSLLLIARAYLVYKQTSFMKDQDLSMELEKIVVLRMLDLSDSYYFHKFQLDY
jgi:hypothetical protein